MASYRPSEYHAGLKWDMEKAGKVIITSGTPYPPSEYHAREKLEKKLQKKADKRKRKGLGL